MESVNLTMTIIALLVMVGTTYLGIVQRKKLTNRRTKSEDADRIPILPNTKFPVILAVSLFGLTSTVFSLIMQLTVGMSA